MFFQPATKPSHFLRGRKAANAARASSDCSRSLKYMASVSTRLIRSSRLPRNSLRASATAPAGNAAISRAACKAVVSKAAGSTTALTSPAALASSADIERPMTRRAKARAYPRRIGPSRLDADSEAVNRRHERLWIAYQGVEEIDRDRF